VGLFSKKKKVVIGYRYRVGMHLGLCQGLDAITKIVVGDKTAWEGEQVGSGSITIDEEGLFGGEESEGGISGTLDVAMGEPGQAVNDYLAGQLPGRVPAYRGVCCLVLRQMYLGMQPYLKPWAVRGRAIFDDWYAAKARIGDDANPAHLVYELLTSPTFGLGQNVGALNDADFRAAADTLDAEGFGLSFLWDLPTPEAAEDAVRNVLRHIDGSLYLDPESGQFRLALMRDDYDPAGLVTYGPGDIAQFDNYSRPAARELKNTAVIRYLDRESEDYNTITVQDTALLAATGTVNALSEDYDGCLDAALANRLAARDLRQMSTALARCTIVGRRTMAGLRIGDVFKADWPELGITGLVLRVVNAGYGTLTDGRVRLECVEDVFGTALSHYATPPPTGWQDPVGPPADAPVVAVDEAPYMVVQSELTGTFPAGEGAAWVLATAPSGDALDFGVWISREGLPYEEFLRQGFSQVVQAPAGLEQDATEVYAPGLQPGWMIVGAELIYVTAADAITGIATLVRGLADSTPKAHAIGADMTMDPDTDVPDVSVPVGEPMLVKVTPRTGQGELALADATEYTLNTDRRYERPYAPGALKANGAFFPDMLTGDVVLTWHHRDRVAQGIVPVQWFEEADYGPEAGQTVTLRFYDGESGALLHTEAGLTGKAFTWTEAAEIAANGGTLTNLLRITAHSVRDGLESWQGVDWTAVRDDPNRVVQLALTNGDAETGDASGWTSATNTLVATGAQAYEGLHSFSWADNSPTGEAWQEVDFSGNPAVDLAAVDAGDGSALVATWRLAAGTGNDPGALGLSFYDGAGALISGPVVSDYAAPTSWTDDNFLQALPPLTRRVRVHLYGQRAVATNIDAFYDGVRLYLSGVKA